MKLLRHGPLGHEKPGILDRHGRIRDLSRVIPDISAQTIAAGRRYLKSGDVMRLAVEGLGEQRQRVVPWESTLVIVPRLTR
jgi:2-keto-4-pentenoate hydratase/2-oxohepta-3-ene-1,7-dioic acid hydratase in catechol pathway